MNKGPHGWAVVAAVVILALAGSAGLAAAAADPQLDWWVVAGGGGSASGGDYQVEGAAGQAAAGLMTGGAYELGSGFWGGGALTRAAYGIHLPVIIRSR